MRSWFTSTGLAALAAAALAACGAEFAGELGSGTEQQALSGDNGFSPNGLSQNGLSQNGLSQNGLSQNGLSQNGLSQNGFSAWFNGNPVMGDTVMRYLVKCAVASGQSRTWTNPATGVSYTWPGDLGLAPGWSGGTPATLVEQQVITACLAAHVNRYGTSVPICLNGRGADNAVIPHGPTELTDYPQDEGAFFGNLFNGEGVFVCQKHAPFTAAQSSVRACAFDTSVKGTSTQCAPMVNTGDCSAFCSWKGPTRSWQACNWNGINYQPITTRIRAQDVYTCGDGICQVSEHCGTGTTADSCMADCGPCP
jgi:hypothetical protein